MYKIRAQGFGLVEVLVGAAIVSLVLVASIGALYLYSVVSRDNLKRVQGGYLLEEGVEATRFIRDSNWSAFSALEDNVPYFLAFSNGLWSATTSDVVIAEEFYRTVTLSSVYRRDSDDDIVPATSTESKYLDPDTRRASVNVIWGREAASDISYVDGSTASDLASFPSNDAGDGDPAQGFTTGSESIRIFGVELPLVRASATSPSDIYLEIREGGTTGTVLASSTVRIVDQLSESSPQWLAFIFTDIPLLDAAETYYLRLRSIPDSTAAFSGSEGTVYWSYGQEAGSPYAGGDAYRYVGRQGNESDEGQVLDQYDFSFRILESKSTRSLTALTYFTNLFSP
jgi:hypothetical protein